MRILFMGTPDLAATILEAVAAAHEVVGAFTRPDAVRGRGRKLVASPVKDTAERLGIEVHTPPSLRGEQVLNLVRGACPDAICVAAYGAILPPEILAVPRYGCLNVHTSLLPRWRGAAPIERAIMARDERTGVCIMQMEEGLDTGPYCVRKTTEVGDKYLGELAGELAQLGASSLLEALERIEAGTVEWTPQSAEGLSYASKIAKGELDCDPCDAAEALVAKVRASNNSHPSRAVIAGRRVACERARVVAEDEFGASLSELAAGEAAFISKRLLIGAADGVIEIEQVKPEGKKSMEGRAFAAGIQGLKATKASWGRS